MLETIEKLLVLQDRDQKIRRVQQELAQIGPERETFHARSTAIQAQLDALKNRVKQIESDRKRLELDVGMKKQQIEKYANQQLQTRKNEEYRALSHEIETCRAEIIKIEDQDIVLMEQAEEAQKEAARLARENDEAKTLGESQMAQLDQCEQNLLKELAELEQGRAALAGAVEETARSRYERLSRSKGENVVVGVPHGVCSGCHVKLPPQILVMCQAQQEIVSCTNCGRILYYSPDMSLARIDP